MVWGMKNYLIQLFGASTMEGRIGVEKTSERWYELLRAQLCEQYPAVCFSIYNGAVGGESLRERMSHLATDLAGHTSNLCLASFAWNNDDWEHPERVVPLQEQETLIQRFFEALPPGLPVVGVIGSPCWTNIMSSMPIPPMTASDGNTGVSTPSTTWSAN